MSTIMRFIQRQRLKVNFWDQNRSVERGIFAHNFFVYPFRELLNLKFAVKFCPNLNQVAIKMHYFLENAFEVSNSF